MSGSLGNYLFLLRRFRNGLALVENLRRGGWLEQGPPAARLVLWDGRAVTHPAHRGGLVPMVLELWRDNEYRIGTFYQPRPGDVIADIGAHIGLFSLMVLDKEQRVRLLALEPSPENFGCLERNLSAFAPQANTRICNLAIGAGFGKINMGPLQTNRSFDARTVKASATDPDGIPAVPLAHLFELAGTDSFALMKIDVEGAEYEVFAGVNSALLKRVERFAIEYHDNYRSGTAALLHERLAPTHQVTVLPDRGQLHGRVFGLRHDLARELSS